MAADGRFSLRQGALRQWHPTSSWHSLSATSSHQRLHILRCRCVPDARMNQRIPLQRCVRGASGVPRCRSSWRLLLRCHATGNRAERVDRERKVLIVMRFQNSMSLDSREIVATSESAKAGSARLAASVQSCWARCLASRARPQRGGPGRRDSSGPGVWSGCAASCRRSRLPACAAQGEKHRGAPDRGASESDWVSH